MSLFVLNFSDGSIRYPKWAFERDPPMTEPFSMESGPLSRVEVPKGNPEKGQASPTPRG
jgi:hypothetical protein